MRTAVACFVLAAAIAAPGIVVAATSSAGHGGQFTTVIVPPTGLPAAPTIDPALRSTVRALARAFAKKHVMLDALPFGTGTAIMFPPTIAVDCQTFIVVQTLHAHPYPAMPRCSTSGADSTDHLTVTFTPASIQPTVADALLSTSGNPVRFFSNAPTPFFKINGHTAIGFGKWQHVVDDPALHPVEHALVRIYRSKGIELRFLPIGLKTVEAFQSGSGRCLVDIVLSTRVRPQPPGFPTCATRTTRSHGVWVTFAPPSAAPTVRQALTGPPR